MSDVNPPPTESKPEGDGLNTSNVRVLNSAKGDPSSDCRVRGTNPAELVVSQIQVFVSQLLANEGICFI
jgi:hypothetical protein